MNLKSLKWIHIFCFLVLAANTFAQQQEQQTAKEAKKAMLHDTLDGKFDFSRFLIDAKGFIPVPFIITEPALGSFGLAVAPMFIQPKKIPGYKRLPPDITAGFGMYTVNGSWGIGGIRIGSFPKAGLKYRIGTGYVGLNLSFYRTLPQVGEKEFAFNIKALPALLSLSKKIAQKSEIYLGLQYQYAKTNLKPVFKDTLPSFISEESLDKSIASLGTFLDWDIRDNIFTPDKGARINILYSVNDQWTGSDFQYQMLNGSLNWFFRFKSNWVFWF
jgi:Omp85 superfamily domain